MSMGSSSPSSRSSVEPGDEETAATLGPNPWDDGPPKAPEYPSLAGQTLYVIKKSVTKEQWPYPKIYAEGSKHGDKANIFIPYFKHVGFGQPPKSLQGYRGSIYVDYSTEDAPIVYVWRENENRFVAYNEMVVILKDRAQSLDVLYHPSFEKDRNYLGSTSSQGISWVGWRKSRKPDEIHTKQHGSSYTCDWMKLFGNGRRHDLYLLKHDPVALKRKKDELERRHKLKPPALMLKLPAFRPAPSSDKSSESSKTEGSDAKKRRIDSPVNENASPAQAISPKSPADPRPKELEPPTGVVSLFSFADVIRLNEARQS